MHIQHVTHAKLTAILGREPWSLPSNETTAPRATDLLKTMSQRAAAERLGISRRQLAKLVAQAESTEEPNPFDLPAKGEPTMTRAGAIATLRVLAEQQGELTNAMVTEYCGHVYGRGLDGKTLATKRQFTAMREAVQSKSTPYVPAWLDKERAQSQMAAMMTLASRLQEQLCAGVDELAEQFPGADKKKLSETLMNLLASHGELSISRQVLNIENAVEKASAAYGDKGPAPAAARVIKPLSIGNDDPEIGLLCL
ncbi:hypothetical protein I9018_13940 [Pseudomonas sp. MPFS]|uniref:hypothetical protein n=1 Tax=Pseudomonas sp. MPFS TaxID=2795724 RepID=UPI001F1378D2|nr:hypothetical protein [Pseudomonas sp. MPFS]UMZ14725.1 hypothetical protein I9018_13940 [Pseudomonas sp. MPFS]